MSIFDGDTRYLRYYCTALLPPVTTGTDVTNFPCAKYKGGNPWSPADINTKRSDQNYPQYVIDTPEGHPAISTIDASESRALNSVGGEYGVNFPGRDYSFFLYCRFNKVPSWVYGTQSVPGNDAAGGVDATGHYQLANFTAVVTDLPMQSGWHLVHFRHTLDGNSYVQLRDGTKSSLVDAGSELVPRPAIGRANWGGPFGDTDIAALLIWVDDDNGGMTDEIAQATFAQMEEDLGIVSTPHPGIHEVQDLTHANDPNNIYFGQGVQIGDQFSYKETTETNGWGVSIDAFGYPIIDPEGGSGTDSFLFNIDRGAGWEPEPPASYAWDFTIGVDGPVPPTYAPRVTYLRRPIAWDASSGWQGVDGGTWSASGLPAGYVINSTSGIVTGTATDAGTTQTIVTVDGVSAAPFDWTVEEKPGGGGSGSRGVNILRPKVHTRDIKRRGWRMGRRGRR